MITALVPSRGLLHTETVEAIDRELMGFEHHPTQYTHDKPIPDCFNYLSEKFLETDAKYAWFVEEDVVPPEGALKKLVDYMETGYDISFINYPLVKFNGEKCYKYFQGHIVWTGLGCTLVKREVFEKLKAPRFMGGYSLVAIMSGSAQTHWRIELRPNSKVIYGGQDVYFCTNAFLSGFKIGVVPNVECQHLLM